MKEKFKKIGRFILKFSSWIIVAIFFFGIGLAINPTKIVEKEKIVIKEMPVEKIVNKEVEKIVIPEDYKELENNYSLCLELLQVSADANEIAGDIFGDLSYYLSNPSALDAKTEEIIVLTKKMKTLTNQKIN